nr:MAG TPA: hypothetical protein [Bacteriophage sp.]
MMVTLKILENRYTEILVLFLGLKLKAGVY